VRAGRDLRHHTAEARVFVHTGRQGVPDQDAVAHQSDAGLVARRLDAEYERHQDVPPVVAMGRVWLIASSLQ